jgi:esterase/lipase superfamily enzyme
VLLYIHGFNETFESATLDAARLSDALKFRGDTVVFSWPSRNSVLSYMSDRESASFSRDALDDTLDDLLSNPNVGRVHIVAHSMGGMLTVEALRQVHARNKGYMSRFGAIVFAAPDIDVDGFSASVRRLGSLPRQMTVISAKDDRALAISASLAGGRRVGRLDKASLEQLGIKVVDASGLGGMLGHDTFLNDASVQKVVAEAIQTGRTGTSGPSPVPVFEQSPPPISQEPLPAVPQAQAPVQITPAAPVPAAPPGPTSSAPYPPAAAPAQPLASAQ